mmetsp:Transcript_6651/g.17441  ORF Transcript_6651/g.17441 Transcript_6651/m.17441 type:complete len:322 (+) Transcript_6651:905-1870(+)
MRVADALAETVRDGLLPDALPAALGVHILVPGHGRLGEAGAAVGVRQPKLLLKLRLVDDGHPACEVVHVKKVLPVVDAWQLVHVVLVREHEGAVGGHGQRGGKLDAHADVVEAAVPGLEGDELVGDRQRRCREVGEVPVAQAGEQVVRQRLRSAAAAAGGRLRHAALLRQRLRADRADAEPGPLRPIDRSDPAGARPLPRALVSRQPVQRPLLVLRQPVTAFSATRVCRHAVTSNKDPKHCNPYTCRSGGAAAPSHPAHSGTVFPVSRRMEVAIPALAREPPQAGCIAARLGTTADVRCRPLTAEARAAPSVESGQKAGSG